MSHYLVERKKYVIHLEMAAHAHNEIIVAASFDVSACDGWSVKFTSFAPHNMILCLCVY